ncbi:Kynurenine 3-monooxygenase [Handroanthus impetiginosus]|uniref:Kynurenine 3-monooxygenase n=1 Tax=Handroanthus impetiginosus TaxID=429701 RepID=A0A2G9GGG4_9LAMI|nr:Kynurenine 3-monooxygenase [Handroanthus impetiginosus]
METAIHEDILIVGAGIGGLTTALGLHRLGIRSLLLESSDSLRITGFALTMWTNAWRALDCVGIGDSLRAKSLQIQDFQIAAGTPSQTSPVLAPDTDAKFCKSEIRCVRRKDLLETLERELPQGTIRYSSKVVHIEESGKFKFVHLADGSVYRTKVLIGCDGVNSRVAKFLGLQGPVGAGRSAIRGYVVYLDNHGFKPKFHAYFGGGTRFGFAPIDEKSLYWFCTFSPSLFNYDENEQDPLKMKQFVLRNIHNASKDVKEVVERTELDCISIAAIKLRLPWNVLLGNIVKNNVCLVGDALHPMTPELGQGGSSTLEDSIVLARCLGEALSSQPTYNEKEEDEAYIRMERGLQKYAKERRWRSFTLISTAYVVGTIQQSDSKLIGFIWKKFLSRYYIRNAMRIANFDFGELIVP